MILWCTIAVSVSARDNVMFARTGLFVMFVFLSIVLLVLGHLERTSCSKRAVVHQSNNIMHIRVYAYIIVHTQCTAKRWPIFELDKILRRCRVAITGMCLQGAVTLCPDVPYSPVPETGTQYNTIL